MKNILLVTVFVLLAPLSNQAQAQSRDAPTERRAETKFTVQLNPEYASGKYGGSTTIEDQYLGLGLRYDTGAWTFKATLPYLQVSADRAFTRTEPGEINCRRSGTECTSAAPTTTTGVAKQTQSGLADIGASATYHLPALGNGMFIDIIGRGKFGTASKDSGLGSGRNDFSLATALSYENKYWEPYVELGYKWRGSSDNADLLNQTAFVTGAKFFVGQTSSIDVSYDVRSKSYADEAAARSASLALTSRLSRQWKIEGYYIHGLSDVVADRVLGVSMAYRY